MDNKDNSGHAETEQFHGGIGTADTAGSERQTSHSQRLADVTTAYRSALAEDDAEQQRNATLQLEIDPLARARAAQQATDAEELDVEEIVLHSDSDSSGSANQAAESNPPVEEEVADDVDDLNSYMQSFLQRMKVNPAAAPTSNAAESRAPAERAVAAEPQPAATDQPAKPTREREYSGPKTAPECKNDISAMRELANETTKVSLSDHAARRGKRVGRYMAISAACCLLSAGLALTTQTIHSYLFIAAVATYGGAMFAAWRAWAGLRELSGTSAKPKQAATTEADNAVEQPAAEAAREKSD